MSIDDDRELGWGIVATGGIARSMASDLARLENAALAAVSSRDLDRAQAFAGEFGVASAYDSVRKLVEDPDVDIVYVATPHPQHSHAVRLAAAAGKAVLCEKAFTHSLAETESLVDEVRARGVFCMEAMWTRFNPLIVKARQMVADGAIGEVRSVSADLGFVAPTDPVHRLWNPALGGGVLLDVGIYPVAFAQMLLGVPQSVTVSGVLSEQGVDAEVGMMLSWPNGARAHLEASLTTPQAGGASIVGTLGRIEISPRFHRPGHMVHVSAPERGVEHPEEFQYAFEGRGYVPMLRAVAQAVREGRTECPEMPLSDTVEVMRILDDALQQLGVRYPDPAPTGE
ncbi:Gfo/Idh/MocA family oxidoreductase [Phytoactinopolyspora alkaliphila]|uniref:Gfo/Idh/MocA family oxidoreductase n=1 Tax=Phytoactinopolyspora alkaliphila TaxID=1783498 RepID=A0A6N9YGU7_9ACTN|nr:Gfo/Idh/MocA family oxidoreductase [Phytoactinopolyspora alkaliphila]NED94223.1 Gfo/Idh/MocA family oxidoreductase [Phytoactinopolyspora alkaliphila]